MVTIRAQAQVTKTSLYTAGLGLMNFGQQMFQTSTENFGKGMGAALFLIGLGLMYFGTGVQVV